MRVPKLQMVTQPASLDAPPHAQAEIVSKGHKGYIGVGFQTEDVSLSRLPGWDLRSYGG